MRGVLTIAHRGASGHAPEHTFAAYDLALEMGADYLEQDLQLTADGVLVCMHDDTLTRTGGRPDRVDALTLAELREVDVGSWFGEEFAGARVPTLEEVLDRYGHGARYYIETKDPDTADRMEERLVELLRAHDLLGRVLIQSFSAASLKKVRALEPELPLIQLIGHRGSAAIRDRLDELAAYAFGVGPHKHSADAELIDAAHARGLHVHPWTLDEPAELEQARALGADGVFTNYPDRLRALTP
jgi:glycerophosphoryl diester phosphodiesterase